MMGVIGILAFLSVLTLSLVITRLASVALMLTGLSEEAARFQARSAFTGTGFTTSESEKVVNHPVRRQVIGILMILRSAGLITIVLSLILSFAGSIDAGSHAVRLLGLLAGAFMVLMLSRSRLIDKWMERIMERLLKKYADLDARDYAGLLNLSNGFRIGEMHVDNDDWVAGKKISACKLTDEGVTILGIQRDDGDFVGVPQANTRIFDGDMLLLYGRNEALRDLDTRSADYRGEQRHRRAVEAQEEAISEQERQDREHQRQRRLKKLQAEASEADEDETNDSESKDSEAAKT